MITKILKILKMTTNKKALIIGSGFGGIASALRLKKIGFEVTLVERLDMLGGRARVFQKGGYRHDAGPTVITAPFLFEELFELYDKNLKDHLNFKLTTIDRNIESNSFDSYDVLFCHQDFFTSNPSIEIFKKSNKIKILAYNSDKVKFDLFADKIFLPTKFEEINRIIEGSIIKKNFSFIIL